VAVIARLYAVLCALAILVAIDRPAAGEPRVALVIGNSAYGPDIGKLKNPANDARLLAETLRSLGFSVELVLDADQKAMKRAIKGFGAKLRAAGPEATGLFYYAGHGVQVDGTNFLLPVGAEVAAEADVEIESIAADDVMTQMQSADIAVNLVFLDACRNNPLARTSRSATRGLARLDAPRGSFVGYSTAPGDVSADGDGANSPYALALAEELRRPGISVEEAHRNVRARVLAATGEKQTPWDSSSLTAPVILAAKGGDAGSPPQSAVADHEALFWDSIKSSANADDYRAYLKRYPAGTFADLARSRIAMVDPGAAAAGTPPAAELPAAGAVSAIPSGLLPGQSFRDCAECPEMVVVPSGRFVMGSPRSEQPRHDNEGPQHEVTIPRMFAVGKYEVTLAEFRRFSRATGYRSRGECWIDIGGDGKWELRTSYSWDHPEILGRVQNDREPAVCVTWDDAQAYLAWLSQQTGKPYRLLTEAEWEYAARAGAAAAYPWGASDAGACRAANGADTSVRDESWYPAEWWTLPCSDGRVLTAPVGSYGANGFGLFDMIGNAWEWVADCYRASYDGAPTDGTAVDSDCSDRVTRGGSWSNNQWALRSASRRWVQPGVILADHGFRVAQDL
jgi:formylglycine-generating enzyme required for sulfatase activity